VAWGGLQPAQRRNYELRIIGAGHGACWPPLRRLRLYFCCLLRFPRNGTVDDRVATGMCPAARLRIRHYENFSSFGFPDGIGGASWRFWPAPGGALCAELMLYAAFGAGRSRINPTNQSS